MFLPAPQFHFKNPFLTYFVIFLPASCLISRILINVLFSEATGALPELSPLFPLQGCNFIFFPTLLTIALFCSVSFFFFFFLEFNFHSLDLFYSIQLFLYTAKFYFYVFPLFIFILNLYVSHIVFMLPFFVVVLFVIFFVSCHCFHSSYCFVFLIFDFSYVRFYYLFSTLLPTLHFL